jgi:ATP-dependent helicase HrpA
MSPQSPAAQNRGSHSRLEHYQALLSRVVYPPELPITAKRAELIQALQQHRVIIVAGETGSGKTTQLPKICLEAGFGLKARIGCTQPRRVAAVSISRRIAAELGVTWGHEVGCKIRFADETGPLTCIKMMTDGILLAEAQGDPSLREYEAVIIDEAHERSLNIDFLLGHLKRLLQRRTDLKLIITSATIDTQAFSHGFDGAPIIEVSGRLYPVEVRYVPLDEAAVENGDLTYIDAAVQSVDSVLEESDAGDILVFMPGERDIRETRDLLQGRYRQALEIVPLFGRLSAAEQERVFAPSSRRKAVIATNIAETSLTIPGIRYVIDTGLARISRYSPGTRTKRLPVEPISQSSADQRKGRSGRVADGICIRLYSEEDFSARPRYTQPEIQRADLAEVILRMKAFNLGDIETFPFLNPPAPPAIRTGYQLLQELGALDTEKNLTPLGRDLARLPIDPAIGRMILQSRHEHALREVLVVAAGLSIQDPRERPMDKRAEAELAHRQFADPASDFLTLLNIWNAFHEKWETLRTQNQMRKFCRAHFLSYNRLREWGDLHAELQDTLDELDLLRLNQADADYAAIHRSILTGLWGHVAQKTSKNFYRASGNRNVMLFPGSCLFNRAANAKAPSGHPREPSKESPATHQPDWIVAGEIVETSRLYARTAAHIDPEWIIELGAHLCRFSYSEPHWSTQSGRVLVRERIALSGLEVSDRLVAYGKINPQEATELFIRSALVEGELTAPHQFMQHNRRLRQKVELLQTRIRHHGGPGLDQLLFEFYARHLQDVSSVHDLNRVVRERLRHNPQFLFATEADLTAADAPAFDPQAFPDSVAFGNEVIPLSYAYAPGEDHDGVTMRVPLQLVRNLQLGMLEWTVPGLREEQITCLLRALPKTMRRQLMPLPPKAKEIAARLQPSGGSLLEALSRDIQEHFGIRIPASAWPLDTLPEYLRPRLEIVGKDHKIVATSRDLKTLETHLRQADAQGELAVWRQAAQRWERFGLTRWTFGDLPEQVEIAGGSGLPLVAFPGLLVEADEVCLRLFRKKDEAQTATEEGFRRLCELALQRELAWLQKDLRPLEKLGLLYVTLGSTDELESTASAHLSRYLFQRDPLFPLTEAGFKATVEQARSRLPGLAPRFIDAIGRILELRQQLLVCRHPYASLRQDLAALLPPAFLNDIPFERLQDLPRYLKAMLVRGERAALNPLKDRERAQLVKTYLDALVHLKSAAQSSLAARKLWDEFRWMIEEFKVSCFAQELGTAKPVSPRRLDQHLESLRAAIN